jgi:hypothetical protein
LPIHSITTCFHAAEDEELTVRIALFEQLHRCGVRLTPHTRLQRIDGGAVVVSNVYSRQELRLEGVDGPRPRAWRRGSGRPHGYAA